MLKLLFSWINIIYFPNLFHNTNMKTQTFCCVFMSRAHENDVSFSMKTMYRFPWKRKLLKTLSRVERFENATVGSLSKRGRRQHWEAIKIFQHNPCVFLGIYLLWLPCLFLFSLNFSCFQRLFLNEKVDVNSWLKYWDVSHLEQDGTNVSFISHIHVHFMSCVISFIVLPTLPSSSSAVLLRVGDFWKRLVMWSQSQSTLIWKIQDGGYRQRTYCWVYWYLAPMKLGCELAVECWVMITPSTHAQ